MKDAAHVTQRHYSAYFEARHCVGQTVLWRMARLRFLTWTCWAGRHVDGVGQGQDGLGSHSGFGWLEARVLWRGDIDNCPVGGWLGSGSRQKSISGQYRVQIRVSGTHAYGRECLALRIRTCSRLAITAELGRLRQSYIGWAGSFHNSCLVFTLHCGPGGW
jgi:hypothetical protein